MRFGPRGGLRARLRPRNIYYGWWIVLAGLASNFLLLGVVVYSFSPFIQPLHEELGWSVAAISFGVSIRSFQSGALSPFTGYLVDLMGPRRMAVTGVIITSLGLLLFSSAHQLWVYYLSSVVIALGQSLGAFNPFSLAVVAWFEKKRATGLGMMGAGSSLGYFAIGIATPLIASYGWRETLVILAAAILVLGVPLALVIRNRPEPYGYLPDGIPIGEAAASRNGQVSRLKTGPPAGHTGMTAAEAVKTPAFYLMSLAAGIGGAVWIAYVVHLVPHLESVGFSTGAIAWIAGIYGVLQATLRIFGSWVMDLVGRKRAFMIGCVIWSVGLLALAHLTPHRLWLLAPFYLFACTGQAAWGTLSVNIYADYFGTRRYATIRGVGNIIALPLGVAAPVLAGWLFDQKGSYVLAYEVLAAGAASGAAWLLFIRRPEWRSIVSDGPRG